MFFQITYLLSRVPVTLRVRRFCTTRFSNSRLWQTTSGETARCHTPRCDLPYPSELNQARPCPAMPFQRLGWVREGSAHERAHPRPAMPFQGLGWVQEGSAHARTHPRPAMPIQGFAGLGRVRSGSAKIARARQISAGLTAILLQNPHVHCHLVHLLIPHIFTPYLPTHRHTHIALTP